MAHWLLALLLSWLGVLGGALTLFSSLQAVIDLADWALWLAMNWKAWMRHLGGAVFGTAAVRNDPGFLLVDLPFALFVLMIAVGSRLSATNDAGEHPSPFDASHRRFWGYVCGLSLLGALSLWAPDLAELAVAHGGLFFFAKVVAIWLVLVTMVSHWPAWLAISGATAIEILLLTLVSIESDAPSNGSLLREFPLMGALAFFVVVFASPRRFTKLAWGWVIVLGVFVALNQLSTLGLDFRAPTQRP
jgi:hypothetical protein